MYIFFLNIHNIVSDKQKAIIITIYAKMSLKLSSKNVLKKIRVEIGNDDDQIEFYMYYSNNTGSPIYYEVNPFLKYLKVLVPYKSLTNVSQAYLVLVSDLNDEDTFKRENIALDAEFVTAQGLQDLTYQVQYRSKKSTKLMEKIYTNCIKKSENERLLKIIQLVSLTLKNVEDVRDNQKHHHSILQELQSSFQQISNHHQDIFKILSNVLNMIPRSS